MMAQSSLSRRPLQASWQVSPAPRISSHAHAMPHTAQPGEGQRPSHHRTGVPLASRHCPSPVRNGEAPQDAI